MMLSLVALQLASVLIQCTEVASESSLSGSWASSTSSISVMTKESTPSSLISSGIADTHNQLPDGQTSTSFLPPFLHQHQRSLADFPPIPPMYQSLLPHSRRLADNDAASSDSTDSSYNWLTHYSIKFQGCHTIETWNANSNDNDVKLVTKALVRYRLCPANFCTSSAAGCKSGYGDYVVDLTQYVKAYNQARRDQLRHDCKSYLYDKCGGCESGDDSNFDENYCKYDCFMKNKMTKCVDRNPYEAEEGDKNKNEKFDINKFLDKGCKEFEPPKNDRRYSRHRAMKAKPEIDEEPKEGLDGWRGLTDAYYPNATDDQYNDDYYFENYYEDEEQDENTKYYIGPYCADQGGRIYVGLFTDSSCSVFADKNMGRTTFKKLTRGKQQLPFSANSLVSTTDCMTCIEPVDDWESDESSSATTVVSEACETIYKYGGKCETHMKISSSHSGRTTLNTAGCSYIAGIRFVKKNGVLDTSETRPNKAASFFIFLTAVSFTLLGAYVYYLRMKLGMKINLNAHPHFY